MSIFKSDFPSIFFPLTKAMKFFFIKKVYHCLLTSKKVAEDNKLHISSKRAGPLKSVGKIILIISKPTSFHSNNFFVSVS